MTWKPKHSIEEVLRVILNRAASEGGTEATRDCPDEERLAAYVEGALPRKDAQSLREHFRRCADCAEVAILGTMAASGARTERKRWAFAATLAIWMSSAAALGYFTIALTASFLGARLLERMQSTMGGEMAAAGFSLGVLPDPALTLRDISFSSRGHLVSEAAVDAFRITASWSDLLKGRLAISRVLIVNPSLEGKWERAPEKRETEGNVVTSASSLASDIAGLLELAPLVQVSGGKVTFHGSSEGSAQSLTISRISVISSVAGDGGGTNLNIHALIGEQGMLSLSGAFEEKAVNTVQWQVTLTAGPVRATRLRSALAWLPLGLQSGAVTFSGTLAGGEEPPHGVGLIKIKNGAVRGWDLLKPLFVGRPLSPEIYPLVGRQPLRFANLAARWTYASERIKVESLNLAGKDLSITMKLNVAPSGSLTGNGTLELTARAAETLRRSLPASSLATSQGGQIYAPVRIDGYLTAPKIIFAGG